MSKKKKFVVTGGAGFIGSHLVTRLLAEGHEVVVIDNLYAGFKEFIPEHENVIHVNVDISNWPELSKKFSYFKGAEGIFHLAACARIQPSIHDPNITNDYNVTGTLNILQLMRMCGVPNIVYSGSSSYYGNGASVPCHEDDPGNPETPYAVTKHMGEEYCQTWSKLYGIKSAVLRYFNVYGRRSPLVGLYAPVVGLFFRQAIRKEDVTIVGDGEQRRDFTHVGDVVDANIRAMNLLSGPSWDEINGEVFNIGTGVNHSINEIAQMVQAKLKNNNVNTKIVYVSQRSGEARETLANNKKAKKLLKWKPTIDLEEGVTDLASYYLNNADKIKKGVLK